MGAVLAVVLCVDGGASVAAAIHARLEAPPVVTGRFRQEKTLAGFKRPVVSSGTFTVTRGAGVEWRTEQPFPSRLSVDRDAIVARRGERELYRLDARSRPGAEVVVEVLFGLLAGELSGLERYFVIEGEVSSGGFTAVLTPRPGGPSTVLGKVTVAGDRTVERVELVEASGDVTRLTLSVAPADGG